MSRDVVMVDEEGLLGCVAAGRISIGLPGLGSASARGAWESKLYLFWFCVSNIEGFNAGNWEMGESGLTQEAHLDCSRCCRPS